MPIDPFFGTMLAAGANLVGGLFGKSAQEKANEANMYRQNIQNVLNANAALDAEARNVARSDAANAELARQREIDRQLQEKFARSGIQWRVEDAKKAGVHPLFALGGSGATYSAPAISMDVPRSIAPGGQAAMMTPETGLAVGLGSMGQDLSRAVNAMRTQAERDTAFEGEVRRLTLQKFDLGNQLLAAQLAKLRAGNTPAKPEEEDRSKDLPIGTKAPDEEPDLFFGSGRLQHDPHTSPQQTLEDRYGEVADYIAPYIFYRDLAYTHGYGSARGTFMPPEFHMALRRSKFDYRNAGDWKGHF